MMQGRVDTSQVKVAVVSHGKEEDFFLTKWVRYYGNLFGQSNLYFVKDRSDWKIPETAGQTNIIDYKFPNSREEFDQEVGRFMSRFCSDLLADYDVVIRTDIDEFLFPDPNKGVWNAVLAEVLEHGYLYALGFDVVHRPQIEAPFDASRGVFDQRTMLRLDGTYCKAHVISRPVQWTGPCHRIDGVEFVISHSLCMAHLALIDERMLLDRLERRGDMAMASRRNHATSRMNKIRNFSGLATYDSYELFDALREGVTDMTRKKGNARVLMPWACNGFDRNIPKGFLVERPGHFKGIL